MSLCPSSSHQLVAAAIAFRRARRKFPKDFGLESTLERISGNTKMETATSCEESINQAKSSSTLMRRACNSRSDHVCRDYDHHSYSKENSITCSCCRARNNGEDISELQDECSGGDAIDTVPSREREEFVTSDADHKNEPVKAAERDRCDAASRTMDHEAAKTTEIAEWIPQSARPTFFDHHRKTRCPSAVPYSNSDPVNLLYDSTPRERKDKVACGDFSTDKGKDFPPTSRHETSIDLDGDAEDGAVTSETWDRRGPGTEDAWMKLDTSTSHRKIVESTWRCRCSHNSSRRESVLDLLKSSCDHCCDECHRCDHRCDCFRRYCCYRQRGNSFSMNAKGCEVCGRGGKTQHKSWHDQMRGENSRLYARQCCSKEYPGIISASRERNDEKRWERKNGNENDDNDEDGNVAVINHKDSMCILAEKYKVGRKCRGRRCGDKVRSAKRTEGDRDECNKSLTSKIIDQPESPLENAVPHDRPSVKHVYRAAHCECCGTTARIASNSCSRGCGRHGPPEGEFDRFKSPLNETAATHRCSSRAPCRRAF